MMGSFSLAVVTTSGIVRADDATSQTCDELDITICLNQAGCIFDIAVDGGRTCKSLPPMTTTPATTAGGHSHVDLGFTASFTTSNHVIAALL
jgi:hypothetical protein